MDSAPRAVEVKATEGYRVRVRFEDGLVAELDFSDMAEEVGYYTDPLRDPDFFRRVDIYPDGHGIFWPNECDVCPDRLYELARQAAGATA
ncbi:MAG TPA: DUF2442 domain-containing protein [Solirubrobacterales bacterium]|nr:DUF2442 domain-containing protein [Solirubrobacterales bacterium]